MEVVLAILLMILVAPFGWVFHHLMGQLAFLLGELLAYSVIYFFQGIVAAAGFLMRGAPAMADAARDHLAAGLRFVLRVVLLAYFLGAELFSRADDGTQDDGTTAPVNPADLRDACAVLGLAPEGLSRAALAQAYKQAMRTAHPDISGDADQAVRINQARDAIQKHFQWN